MTNSFTAHRSPVRMGAVVGLIAALGLLMLLIDLSVFVNEDADGFRARGRANTIAMLAQYLPWIGGAAIVAALAFVPSLLRKRVEIEVSEQGLSYPPALQELLPWDRIERVAVRKMSVYPVLAVFIRDPDSFGIKPMARRIAQMNKASGDYGDINVEVLRSDGDFDELVAAVEKYVRVER